MERELNRSLFGTQPPPAQAEPVLQKATGSADLQILAIQLENFKKKVKDLEGRLEASEGRLEALAQATKLKVEQSATKLDRLEAYVRSTVKDLAEKFATLSGRITNSRLNEDKIEAMLARHNQVVQNFEARMNQMQKLVGEQEIKLMSFKKP